MFVEEGFRIRFGNGEVIDFYADDRASKEGWMKALVGVVGVGAGKVASGQTGSASGGSGKVNEWTQIVLKREGSIKEKVVKSPAKKHRIPSGEKRHQAQAAAAAEAPRTGSSGSAKTGPEFGIPISPRKSSKNGTTHSPSSLRKDAPALPPRSPTHEKSRVPPPSSPAHAQVPPPAPDKSPRHQAAAMQIPQALRPGHARTESYQGVGVTGKRTGLEGVLGQSPMKSRHQKTKSMILDRSFW